MKRWSMPAPPAMGVFHIISQKKAVGGDGFALCDERLKLYGVTGVSDDDFVKCYGEEAYNVKCKRCLAKK